MILYLEALIIVRTISIITIKRNMKSIRGDTAAFVFWVRVCAVPVFFLCFFVEGL